MPLPLIVLAIIVFSISASSWFAHAFLTMDNEHVISWGWGTWKDFWREYTKRQWTRSKEFRYSHFAEDNDSIVDEAYIHAGIIRFGNRGMILYPWSYVLFLLWMLKNREQTKRKTRINWSSEQ